MSKRTILILAVALVTAYAHQALAANLASAVTLQTTDTGHPWQQWADRAQVPTWQGTLPLAVVNGLIDCGGMQADGCTSAVPQVDQTTGQIMPGGTQLASISTDIDGTSQGLDPRDVLYHELGQVFWQEYLTDADKAAFMSIVGLAPNVDEWNNWLYGSIVYEGQTHHFPPFEWFAEGYRYCATYGISQPLGVDDAEGMFYPGDRPAFAAKQRQVCRLIDEIGLRNGVATPTQESYTPTHLTGRVIKVRVRVTRHTDRPRPIRVRRLW